MNLYAKIFIGFWLSMIAIAGSWMIANRYVDDFPQPSHAKEAPSRDHSSGPPDRDRPGPGAPPPRLMYRIYYGMQNLEADALPQWIASQEREHDIRIYLVNMDGREIFERTLEEGTDPLLEKLGRFRRRASLRTENKILFAHRMHRPEWGQLVMVVAISPPSSPLVKLLTEHLWLRLLLAVIISGLISYGVSRYLTRPLKELQQASRKLADGNLDTRIRVPGRGGDETAELARDFNTMASQLQQRIQQQKRLLHDVSHELRSPLARLRVALALAARDPTHSAALLQRMERETERFDELIAQLLAVPEDRLPLDDSLDLVALLQEITEDARFEGANSNRSVALDTSLEEAVVQTHGDLLKKALENVVRNALYYTAEGTVVSIVLARQQGSWLMTVRDHGPGIPGDELNRVFEPFYRVDNARSSESGGFGLGLAIAHRAVEQHGGTITARNSEPGLEIAIELPI